MLWSYLSLDKANTHNVKVVICLKSYIFFFFFKYSTVRNMDQAGRVASSGLPQTPGEGPTLV